MKSLTSCFATSFRSLLLLIVFSVLTTTTLNAASSKTIQITFYSSKVKLAYDPDMLQKNKHCTSSSCLEKFYQKIEASDYQLLLKGLLREKEKLQLNDWFFYNLVRKTIEQIYPKHRGMYHTTTTWFFMTKAGYDTRLFTAQNKYTFLFVRTTDEVYEMPYVKVEGAFYLDLTSIYHQIKTKGLLLELQTFQPGALNQKVFSLKIKNYPRLTSMNVEKNFRFTFRQKEINIKVKVDTIGKVLLANYPFVKTLNYLQAPFTTSTSDALAKAFRPYLDQLELEDQLSFLVSFTRKAFEYEGDQMVLGRDHPLTAEEALVAESSDFEDRTAILYQLLNELTDLNFVVIQYLYDDIVTIGIELPEVYGNAFIHEGVNYTICDPTMPSNTGKLGIYPINFGEDYEILEEFVQQVEVGMRD